MPRGRSGRSSGVLLFQLGPTFKVDLPLFDAFLAELPRRASGLRVPPRSWLDDDVYERLRARNLALCLADSDKRSTPVVPTADYGYFRLRDEGYTRRRSG